MTESLFQRSALASGLVEQQELADAIAALRQADGAEAAVSDERLAEKLIESGRLNAWQAARLREGRTTFTLGPYRILGKIGEGTLGQVYKAEHSVMGRVVAVKVLPAKHSTPAVIASFTEVIRTHAQLDHKRLVRAYDAGHDRNAHFLVTEYVPGADLRQMVRRQGKLDMQTAADIFCQAADGLAYIHRHGLVHRDLKPTNLLISTEGNAKISDLGLAGCFNVADLADETEERVIGSPDYLAPEQGADPDRPLPANDIYALGCTLYYAVTGKAPFPGGTPVEKARAHREQLPRHPRLLNPELSDEFVDIIADMMEKNPQDRIPSAEEVIARLS
ncbi:MAG TPA: serine/threonine-protein kinase [Pirellulales bacterium]|nr:serine/threonine-protein kinase [Pirellulales bacterium]